MGSSAAQFSFVTPPLYLDGKIVSLWLRIPFEVLPPARFSAMARRPRTRAAEGLLAGPSRGRRCMHAPRRRTRGARGGGPVSGARRPRAGRYRLSRPCPG